MNALLAVFLILFDFVFSAFCCLNEHCMSLQLTVILRFRQCIWWSAICCIMSLLNLCLSALSDALAVSSLSMKMLCWRCCLWRDNSSRRRSHSDSDISVMFWCIRASSHRCSREEIDHRKSFRESLSDAVRSCSRAEKQRCSSLLLRISSFSINLYSIRRQNDDTELMSSLTQLYTILLMFSETVYRVSVLQWQSLTEYSILRSKKTILKCLIFLIDCAQCFCQLSAESQ